MTAPADSAVVLFPGALGDFLCFLPTLLALRHRHRGRLLLVAQPALLRLIRVDGLATASIERPEIADLYSPGRLPPKTSTRALFDGYERAYSWTGRNDPDFRARLGGVVHGVVEVHPFRAIRRGEHARDYYARCAAIAPQPPSVQCLAADDDWWPDFERRHGLQQRSFTVLHPGSGAAKKNWTGFEELAGIWANEREDAVLALHGPAEASTLTNPSVIPVRHRSLPEVVALLRRCRVFIGNDSGISHLAAVAGCRGAVLFGPTDPHTWAPRGDLLVVRAPTSVCGSCGPDVFCVHRLPVGAVIEALRVFDGEPRRSQ